MGYLDRCEVSVLIGKTITEIENNRDLIFKCDDGAEYKMYHDQYCCESVAIESIDGDILDLIGVPIVMAEEIADDSYEESHKSDYEPDSCTWTFYKFATVKGYVTIRWYGESNGYYSESVDFEKIS